MENMDIRILAKVAGVPLWKVAQEIGVSEATMTRMLRKELSEEKKAEMKTAIANLEDGWKHG